MEEQTNQTNEQELINLGDKIRLVGFKGNITRADMAVIKKMVGNYVKKFFEYCGEDKVREVSLHYKKHGTEDSHKIELKTKLDYDGKLLTTTATGFNLFVVLNDVLAALEEEIKRVLQKK